MSNVNAPYFDRDIPSRELMELLLPTPWITERRRPTLTECIEHQRRKQELFGESDHEYAVRHGMFDHFKDFARATV